MKPEFADNRDGNTLAVALCAHLDWLTETYREGRKDMSEAEGADDRKVAVGNMHQALLEALRHREQEILRYLAILGPALAGFIWLLTLERRSNSGVFVAGTLGVIVLLFLGSVYALALGYNYRYLTLQLAKFESAGCLGIADYVLNKWPRKKSDFDKYCKRCLPPEVIKTFWRAFTWGIIAVTVVALYVIYYPPPERTKEVPSSAMPVALLHVSVVEKEVEPDTNTIGQPLACGGPLVAAVGVLSWVGAILMPYRFGRKMRDLVNQEPDEWLPGQMGRKSPSPSSAATGTERCKPSGALG